MFDNLTVFIDR